MKHLSDEREVTAWLKHLVEHDLQVNDLEQAYTVAPAPPGGTNLDLGEVASERFFTIAVREVTPFPLPTTQDPDGGVSLTHIPQMPSWQTWADICQLLSDLSTNYQRNQYQQELYDVAGERAHNLCGALRLTYGDPDNEDDGDDGVEAELDEGAGLDG